MEVTDTISNVIGVTPWPRQIYHDADTFWQESRGLHHAYMVYRTLRGDYKHIFQPDAVLYVGKSPSAYLKKVKTQKISDEDIRQWQRFLWNQAVVPFLIVKSRDRVNVYTAYTKPEEKDSQQRIQAILEYVADVLELDQLWTAIESGMIYRQKPEAFLRDNAVDQYLLDNLKATALQLADTQPGESKVEKENNLKFAHHFLTRLLFVCYLVERGMIGKYFNDSEHDVLKKLRPANHPEGGYFLSHLFNDLDSISKKRTALCRIFGYVKRMFNGSLFPDSITSESNRYSDNFIQIINDFLNGEGIRTGQRVLGFWAYDFSVIPIETISAIWESFLGDQGKLREIQGHGDSKRATGAYYTPLHLAELTVDVALEDIDKKTNKPIHELEILDPACGSGVFLVSMFCRIAEDFYRRSKRTRGIEWARKLKPRLNHLYGIDISDTACHITCFSLYLAYLEWLEPNDVEYLLEHGERLPPLLANSTDEKSWNTIHQGNFFDTELALKKQKFDIIIGNPPWVSGQNQKDPFFLKWMSERPQVLGPNKQIAHGFAWNAPKYISDEGVVCFLLPSAILFNEGTNEFQEEWFRSVIVDKIINFSDLRFILFSGALHPCVAIRYSTSTNKSGEEILYESPKTDVISQKGGCVYIREEDTNILQHKDIIHAAKNKNAPMVWKSHYWGSWRDRRFLIRLNNLPKLYNLTGKSHSKPIRWDKGTGIMVGSGKNKGFWSLNSLFLNSRKEFSLVVSKDDCTTVAKAKLPLEVEAPRREKLFKGPKVLISEGSQNIKAGFCNFTVFFKKSIYSIVGPEKDVDYLRFLSIVIKSDLIQYYLFHTSSDWGTERDRIHFYELLSIPFFLPEASLNSKESLKIVNEVARKVERFEKDIAKEKWFGKEQIRTEKSKKLIKGLEPLIHEYYNINKYESMLIDDTLDLAVKSFHPRQDQENISTLIEPNKAECETYTKTLCEMLNHFGKGSQFRVRGEVFKGVPYSVVQVSLTDKIMRSVPVTTAKEKLRSVIKRMESVLQEKKEPIALYQNLKVFDGESLYVLKPMHMRFWSRTTALNDADEIAGYILQTRRGS